MNLFDIYNEDLNGNCLFRPIRRLTYGTPDHHKEIRETVCDYFNTRYKRFYFIILAECCMKVHWEESQKLFQFWTLQWNL